MLNIYELGIAIQLSDNGRFQARMGEIANRTDLGGTGECMSDQLGTTQAPIEGEW